MDTAKLLGVLEVYFEAFAEHDPIRRGELLAQCLTPDCAIWGHSEVYAGYVAISGKIAGFHRNYPDCRFVLASGLMTFENIVRSANAIVRRDGSVVVRGETVSEIAPDGRLCRIVPLWETSLPPLPESWPAHLAAQPMPKGSDAP
ncbi:nuclear transport factor 2 family protein [Ramlibacter sp. PS4R-6]|uniref:nuclear transport factor 2 family protein n=1 Tax=Ramlibacter sp. PS4R-6 TaxID=3133438 RepID=UPI0030A377C8